VQHRGAPHRLKGAAGDPLGLKELSLRSHGSNSDLWFQAGECALCSSPEVWCLDRAVYGVGECGNGSVGRLPKARVHDSTFPFLSCRREIMNEELGLARSPRCKER